LIKTLRTINENDDDIYIYHTINNLIIGWVYLIDGLIDLSDYHSNFLMKKNYLRNKFIFKKSYFIIKQCLKIQHSQGSI